MDFILKFGLMPESNKYRGNTNVQTLYYFMRWLKTLEQYIAVVRTID
jgi:hypothetical protein